MSKSDFMVVCNSQTRYSGGINNNFIHMFDFFGQDDGNYELSFCFVSGGTNDLEPALPAMLSINFGSNLKSFAGGS